MTSSSARVGRTSRVGPSLGCQPGHVTGSVRPHSPTSGQHESLRSSSEIPDTFRKPARPSPEFARRVRTLHQQALTDPHRSSRRPGSLSVLRKPLQSRPAPAGPLQSHSESFRNWGGKQSTRLHASGFQGDRFRVHL